LLRDRKLKSIFLGRHRTGRERWRAVTVILVAALTLLGLGQGAVHLYEGMTDSDQVNRLSAFFAGPPPAQFPVTLIDIDDPARKAWGLPATAPHKALSELIAIARESGALAIVLDFDLSFDNPAQQADPTLYNMLFNYRPEWAPLMIVRWVPFTKTEQRTYTAEAYRATAYDKAVEGKPNVMWISAVPLQTGDRVIRQLRLWQVHCETASGEVHPAAPLALLSLLNGGEHRQATIEYLSARATEECGNGAAPPVGWPPFRERAATIPYTIDGEGAAIGARQIELLGRTVQLARRVGAGVLVDYTPGLADRVDRKAPIDAEPFAGRAVVIGATHADTRDIHMTPFGSMPGALIIANTLASARTMVEVPDAGPLLRNVLAIVLFAVFGYIAAHLKPVPAVVVIGIAACGALALFAPALGFGGGLEAVATGLAAFGMFKLFDSIAGIAHEWRHGKGWHALLKPPHSSAG
jgi:CHASE2 domain-containing sensor protein